MEDVPSPSTRALTKYYYPRAIDIGKQINNILKINIDLNFLKLPLNSDLDVPDSNFKGPF